MLAKGDLKFRLNGKRLKGDFALIKMKGRRPGSKGNEWLMIKKHDDHVVEGYDAGDIDESVLSKRSMDDIAGDARSREWKSDRPAARGKLKAAWLADAIARVEKKKAAQKTRSTPEEKTQQKEKCVKALRSPKKSAAPKPRTPSAQAEVPADDLLKILCALCAACGEGFQTSQEVDANVHLSHAGGIHHRALRQPGLALRDQMGRLSRRSLSRKRQGTPGLAQSERINRTLP